VKLAYVDQSRQTLDDKKTVWRRSPAARTSSDRQLRDAIAQLRRPFNFKAPAATADRRAVGRRAQSGASAKVLAPRGNVLLLDEPTNDLDIETLRALEDALLNSRAAPW